MKNPLLPDLYLANIRLVTPQRLRACGVRVLLSDLDNTLAPPHTGLPPEHLNGWLKELETAGVRVYIVSNNRRKTRVAQFCGALEKPIPWMHMACKPLPFAMWRAMRQLHLLPRETAVLGDQIFTDVLAARACGAKSILVRPITPENTRFFRLKRRLERGLLKRQTVTTE